MDTSSKNHRSSNHGCWLKILIGCGGLALLVVLLGFAGCLWLSKPGEQIETTTILDTASVGTVRVDDLLEDEGFSTLARAVLGAMDAQNARMLPAWFPRQHRSAQNLGMLIPTSVTVTFEGIDGAHHLPFVAAVNFRGWVRVLKMFLEGLDTGEQEVQDYRRHRVLFVNGAFFIAFHRSTLLVSNHHDALVRVIDRLADGTGSGLRPRLEKSLPEGSWDIKGVLQNDTGALDQLFAALLEEGPALAQLGPETSLGFGLELETAERAKLRIDLTLADARQAQSVVEPLQTLAERLLEALRARGFEPSASVRPAGQQVIASVEILGLKDALLEAVEGVADRALDPATHD